MKENRKKKSFDRREFLGLGWAFAIVGLFSQAGAALFQFFKPRIEPGTFGARVIAGKVQEFENGTVTHVSKGRFYISRFEDGGMLALWHKCTHLGCTVPWKPEEGQFHCPCHNSIFNTAGEVLSGPAPRPLDFFPIEIVDGEVVVDTGNPQSRNEFNTSQVTKV